MFTLPFKKAVLALVIAHILGAICVNVSARVFKALAKDVNRMMPYE